MDPARTLSAERRSGCLHAAPKRDFAGDEVRCASGNGFRRRQTPADAVEQASTVLERAIEGIDADVAAAKERIDLAKAEYEQLRDSASERKAALQAKLDALKS